VFINTAPLSDPLLIYTWGEPGLTHSPITSIAFPTPGTIRGDQNKRDLLVRGELVPVHLILLLPNSAALLTITTPVGFGGRTLGLSLCYLLCFP